MYVKRLLEKSLKESLAAFPVVLITGARQAGKTTFVKKVLGEKYRYVSLDEFDIRSLATEDPRAFLEQFPPPVIIDEIQNAPELLSYIKALADKKLKPGRWVLTGSRQFPLMRNVSESLAGRTAVLTLYPFSLDEMEQRPRFNLDNADLYFKSLLETKAKGGRDLLSLGEWLLNGGYPEIFVNKKVSKKIWFSSYVQTYIDRDVRGNIRI